jgi:lipopolysaccharide/colanic/teichoic acid biosynthesis glycosyltransferase
MSSATARVPANANNALHAQAPVWGASLLDLHDREWLERGWQIVRRGQQVTITSAGHQNFVLLDQRQMLNIDSGDSLPSLCSSCTAQILTIAAPDPEREFCIESVHRDQRNGAIRIRRQYANSGNENAVVITNDHQLAQAWASDAEKAHLTIGSLQNATMPLAISGEYCNECGASAQGAFVSRMLERSTTVDRWMPQARLIRPGVWCHITAAVDPQVVFLGSVLVGAGVTLNAGDVIVGPCVLSDVVSVDPWFSNPRDPVPFRVSGGPVLKNFRRHLNRRKSIRHGAVQSVATSDSGAKRIFDVLFSVSCLLVFAPVIPLIMLAIWIEDGWPVFFVHRRQGRGGRPFGCIKFRTMCRNAESMKAAIAGMNICDGPQFHIARDPRLLRIGRLLRRCHLDELPQFLNVLRGEMSVIGPRPSPESENQFSPAWRDVRLSVRPGMTGLWQVCRSRQRDLDFQEWVQYDTEYVKHRSWRLDAWILWRTFRRALLG